MALLAVQGGCALLVQGIYRLSRSIEAPSREARHAAALAGGLDNESLAFPSVMGYVDHFDDASIAVMTAQTLAHVRFDHLTIFRTPEGPARAADVYPGAGVVVFGDVEDGGRVLADAVVIRPAP